MMYIEIESEQLKNAVIEKIISTGYDFPIYKEQILQGFSKPCFFVRENLVFDELAINDYMFRYFDVEVRYHPNKRSTKKNEDVNIVGMRLFETLVSVDYPHEKKADGKIIKKPIYARNISKKIIDGVLILLATYKIRCEYGTKKQNLIETIEVSTKTREA